MCWISMSSRGVANCLVPLYFHTKCTYWGEYCLSNQYNLFVACSCVFESALSNTCNKLLPHYAYYFSMFLQGEYPLLSLIAAYVHPRPILTMTRFVKSCLKNYKCTFYKQIKISRNLICWFTRYYALLYKEESTM